MKRLICILSILAFCSAFYGQQIYCNFEDAKVVIFKTWTGSLDTTYANPDTTGIDTSKICGRYIRNAEPYDNIKMITYQRLLDVSDYASASIHAPKIKMKVFSNMPAGSKVQIQLGSQEDDAYPSGVHSEYWATTTKVNEWEELVFTFSQIPSGSTVQLTDIDKVILMFRPNSLSQDVIYFDELKGPQLTSIGVQELSRLQASRAMNYPNPASYGSTVNFIVARPGEVTLKLYDLFGKEVITVLNENLGAGEYSVPVDITELESGVYFYSLNIGSESHALKVVVSK